MKRKKSLIANALLEFILIIPIFLTLISGLIETSVLLYDKMIITNASREGARYGVVIRSGTYAELEEVQAHVTSYCANKLINFGGSSAVTVSAASSAVDDEGASIPPQFGDTLTVTVTYQFNGLTFFVNLGQPYDIISSTVMPYE